MSKVVKILVLLALLLPSIGLAQHFSLQVDTVWLDVSEHISPTAKFTLTRTARCRDFYFCCFKQQEIQTLNASERNVLLAVSLDGKEVKNVPFPNYFDKEYYFDLFSLEDDLYVKPYWWKESNSYRFNFKTWDWEPVKFIPDIVFEDDKFQVARVDYGEWGSFDWFMDKHSSKQYLHSGWRNIVPVGNTYYISAWNKLYRLKDPKAGWRCGRKLKYLNVQKNDAPLFAINSYYPPYDSSEKAIENKTIRQHLRAVDTLLSFPSRDDTVYFEDGSSFPTKKCDTTFSALFCIQNQLYAMMEIQERYCIVRVEGEQLYEVLDLGKDYQSLYWANYYRGNHPANRCLKIFQNDLWTSGIIDIEDTLVKIHYLIHTTDTLHSIREDHILETVAYMLDHSDHLTINEIDSMERSWGATKSQFVRTRCEDEWYRECPPGKEDFLKVRYIKRVQDTTIVETQYIYNPKDSLVDGFFLILQKANAYQSNLIRLWRKVYFTDEQWHWICDELTRRTGSEPDKDDEGATHWTYKNRDFSIFESGSLYYKP